MSDIVNSYRKLNDSFSRTLVYHIGIDAGFFAEYSYMLNAMLYCLEHKIKFKLYSADANFGTGKGWSEFFLPFCDEVDEGWHHKYNLHPVPSLRTLLGRSRKGDGWDRNALLSNVKWKLKRKVCSVAGHCKALVAEKRLVLLNDDVKFEYKPHYSIPELGIDGDYISAFNKMIDITWRFNAELEGELERLPFLADLKKGYVACQVRGGDKITEADLLSPDMFVSAIAKATTLRNVFVLTDDYRLYETLVERYKDFTFYTLCSSEQKGYVNKDFTRTSAEDKKRQMRSFLISMRLLLDAELFVGSITTGPSFFVLKRLYHTAPERILPIDCERERLADTFPLTIAERGRISAEFVSKKFKR